MATGRIKVRKEAGYGFIAPDEGGKDVFFHVKELARGYDESMAIEGARVGYDVRQGDRGLMAFNVRINLVREPEPEPEVSQYTVDEAFRGLDAALLAVVEWRDVLQALTKAQA